FDGSAAVRLGDGTSPTFSPNGKTILARSKQGEGGIVELPTGAGESRPFPTGNVQVHFAYYFPDGKRILEVGSSSGHALSLWVQEKAGGAPKNISPEGVNFRLRGCITPDGRLLAVQDPDEKIAIYSVDGSQSPR